MFSENSTHIKNTGELKMLYTIQGELSHSSIFTLIIIQQQPQLFIQLAYLFYLLHFLHSTRLISIAQELEHTHSGMTITIKMKPCRIFKSKGKMKEGD